MRELSAQEVDLVSGGYLDGYTAAGLILGTMSAGAAVGPLAPAVWGIGFGAAGGLFLAQMAADWRIGSGGGYGAPVGGTAAPSPSSGAAGGGGRGGFAGGSG